MLDSGSWILDSRVHVLVLPEISELQLICEIIKVSCLSLDRGRISHHLTMSAENPITISSDQESEFTEDGNGPSDHDIPQVGLSLALILYV